MFWWLSKFFLYLSLGAVVIVLPSTFFPFIGGKYYFFRFTIELALIFLILWAAFEAAPGQAQGFIRELMSRPLWLAVSVFAVAFLFATIFADNPAGAFWSNYERGEGGFQMIHYYLFFSLLLILFRNWADWRRALWFAIAAAGLMIAYGFLGYLYLGYPQIFCNQTGCVDFVTKLITPYQGAPRESLPQTLFGLLKTARFQGSLGNPAYVAPHLFFAMSYVLFLYFTARDKRSWLTISGSVLGLLFFLAFFIFSQTRGAFLGLLVAIFAFLILLGVGDRRARPWAASGIIVLVLGGALLVSLRENPAIKNLSFSRLFDLDLHEQTVQTRLWTWGSAWQGFKERPLFGWGPENFSTAFDKYFDPRHFRPGENSETWFDRAHSVVFDYLTETGLFGFLSYLAIFVVFYSQFVKFYFSNTTGFKPAGQNGGPNDRPRAAGHSPASLALLAAVPVGYLIQGLALFDVLPIYINLFLFLALASFLFHERSLKPKL